MHVDLDKDEQSGVMTLTWRMCECKGYVGDREWRILESGKRSLEGKTLEANDVVMARKQG